MQEGLTASRREVPVPPFCLESLFLRSAQVALNCGKLWQQQMHATTVFLQFDSLKTIYEKQYTANCPGAVMAPGHRAFMG